MTFLPIVDRELRVLARRPSTVWLRFYAALGVLLVWLLLLAGSRHTSPHQLSQRLFVAFGVLALGFALLAGVFLTADCLSEEKREGTLGLLFLTDLRGYDVVLGKLVATSVHAFYGLLAIFPVLALPLLMGGVSVGEFWRLVLVLLVTLFLSLGLGMLSSALYREARQAMGITFLLLLVLAGVLPLCWWLLTMLGNHYAPGAVLWLSPFQTFRAAFDSYYLTRSGGREFWLSVQLLAALGFGCLLLASVVLPRAWQERKALAPAADASERRRPAESAARGLARPGREELLDANPWHWLASRRRLPGLVKFSGVALFALWGWFLLIALNSARNAQFGFIVCLFMGYGLHQVFKFFAIAEATRQVNEDRRSGALELLLVTPLSEREILAGHARAFRSRCLPFALLTASLNALLILVVMQQRGPLHMRGSEQGIFIELFVGGLLALGLDFWTIEVVGFWAGLRAPRHSRAMFKTLATVMGVPWGAAFLMVFLMMGGSGSQDTVFVIFGFWFVVGVITDMAVLARANQDLHAGLRTCLTEPVVGPPCEPAPGAFDPQPAG